MRYQRDFKAYPTFSAMPDSLELAPTLSDVGRHPEIAMAAYKPEVVITRERHEISARTQRLRPYFRPCPTHRNCSRHCPISTDIRPTTRNSNVGEQTDFLAAIAISGCRSDVVRQRTMLEIALACWAWSKTYCIRLNLADISCRSRVITTSGLLAAIAISGCRPTSDNVGASSNESGMAENMGIGFEISPISHAVPELLLLPVYRPPLLFPDVGRHRTMSGPVPMSQHGRKCGVAVEISPISHAVPELLLLPVYRPPLLFPDVGRHRAMSGQVPSGRAWPKLWGSILDL